MTSNSVAAASASNEPASVAMTASAPAPASSAASDTATPIPPAPVISIDPSASDRRNLNDLMAQVMGVYSVSDDEGSLSVGV